MRVRATQVCYVKYLREIGHEFEIEPAQFNQDCMEKIEDESEGPKKTKRAKKDEDALPSRTDDEVI